MSDRLVSYLLLIDERMSGGSIATSHHVLSLHLDDKDAHLSRNVPLTEEWMGSLERESSAHLLEDDWKEK